MVLTEALTLNGVYVSCAALLFGKAKAATSATSANTLDVFIVMNSQG